jgi:hypothetical protein
VSGIDWPLAILLAVMFVVMSFVRWRYFKSAARRWGRKGDAPRKDA